MDDITTYFISLLQQMRSADLAEAEFRRALDGDDDLRQAYREWCAAHNYTERRGFAEFCEEYIESQNSIWDTLTDYDEDL